MLTPRSTEILLLTAALGMMLSRAPHPPRPESEPALRARVTLGEEVLELELGRSARTADGRSLVVELLPTRSFAVPGALAFEYPRDWSFVSVRGVPGPADGWWSFSGDGALVYLRRHGGDPRAAVEEYSRGLQALASATALRVERALDGHRLLGRGIGVDVEGRATSRDGSHEVYGWRHDEGVSWLLAIQREPSDPSPSWLAAGSLVLEDTGAGLEFKNEAPPAAKPFAHVELDSLLASWRWE